ncbi:MAG: alpha/beta hydrolase [Dokdonella sp.]|uniref:alpha/beta hydrolase n=1 Tax=Dokdonella sp. TaxID=2291710 RepID=UPI003266CCFC
MRKATEGVDPGVRRPPTTCRVMRLRLLLAGMSLFIGSTVWADQSRVARVSSLDAPVTEIGALDGVAYRIDIPRNWNHGLVVFFHGYSITPITFRQGERSYDLLDPILAKGYAVIQSAYSATGWAIEQGSADTEKLRRSFVAKHGASKPTFVMGMSMGGALTAMTIEQQPDTYAGALALCGAIEPTDRFMQRDFALRAAFDYYFPGVFGALVPVPSDYKADGAIVAKIAAAMKAKPDAAASLRAIYSAGDIDSLPGVLAFITYDIKELQHRTHGNPYGNEDLVYTGSADDFALNDGVKRYRAEARPAAYLSRWYTPTGKLLKPMLALHTSGDPLVVASTAFEYAIIAQRAGHAANFVQQYVNADGHCVFTPAQVGRSFDDLVEWTKTGKRPRSGKQR